MVAGAAFMLLVFVLVIYLDLSKTGLLGSTFGASPLPPPTP